MTVQCTCKYLVRVDELGAQLVLALKEAPVHLDVPREGVAGTDDGRHNPQGEGDVVADGLRLCDSGCER